VGSAKPGSAEAMCSKRGFCRSSPTPAAIWVKFSHVIGAPLFDGFSVEIRVYCVYSMNSRELIKMLKKDGWFHAATKGSHWHFKHPTKKGRVTVPHPKRELPIGTLRSVLRQAGLELRRKK
jgi:predicted RNA binding protein YcfA (HicA-like mRNA interferase family)